MSARAVARAAALLGATLGASLLAPAAAAGQGSLASRIDAVRTGTVRLVYAARPGVCGDGMNWYRTRPGSYTGSFTNSHWGRDVEVTCQPGPVRVVVAREDGEIRDIRTYVGGRWKADTGITDLGTVSAPEAARWLLSQAERAQERIANAAMSAATLADSTDASAQLLRLVQDEKRPQNVRASALRWLGETAGEKVSARLDSIAYEPGDREVRKQAIYALSRRPAEEAVPALLKMVESLPDRELRRTAVYWLAQTKDPRAIAWIQRQVEAR
jgi:hypothetical protein